MLDGIFLLIEGLFGYKVAISVFLIVFVFIFYTYPIGTITFVTLIIFIFWPILYLVSNDAHFLLIIGWLIFSLTLGFKISDRYFDKDKKPNQQ